MPANAGTSSLSRKPKTKKLKAKRSKATVVINVTDCKYEAVRRVAQAKGWTLLDESGDSESNSPQNSARNRSYDRNTSANKYYTTAWWNVYWTDTSVAPERVMRMSECQKINHFPGMYHLSRKGGLGRQLGALKRVFPEDFGFVPPTWILPAEWNSFRQQFTRKANRTFIIKPDASCQGKGIFLTRTWENVNPNEPQVAQRYLHKPLLIDRCKFDMRLYVLVSSVDPLRVYLFHEGLIRICTEEYVEPTGRNLSKTCMHLTNYSINKDSDKFVPNRGKDHDHEGNKRSLTWFRQHLRNTGKDPDQLWAKMEDLIVKTLISGLPHLQQTYQSCVRPSRPKGEGLRRVFRSPAPTKAFGPVGPTQSSQPGNTPSDRRLESTRSRLRGIQTPTPTISPHGASPTSTKSLCLTGHQHLRIAQRLEQARRAPHPPSQRRESAPPPHAGPSEPAPRKSSAPSPSCCFEILGFDVMVDRKLQPWLIEVNHSPSFACDTPLDAAIKSQLIHHTLDILNVRASDRRKTQRRHARAAQTRLYGRPVQGKPRPRSACSSGSEKRRLSEKERQRRCEERSTADGAFKRIYPVENEAKALYYDQLIQASKELNRSSTMGRSSSRENAASFEHLRRSVRATRLSATGAETVGG